MVTEKEYKAKQKALKAHMAELDRLMPRFHWRDQYSCRLCGALVTDRNLHLRWHKGTDMIDVLITLFGRPN